MSGLDRRLDPVTGDYIDAPGGEYAETRTAEVAIYHQLKGHRNLWWADPDAGSNLRLLSGMNLDRNAVAFAENDALASLQRLVDDGLIEDPEAVAVGSATGRLLLETTATDVQTGEALVLPAIGGQ